MFPYRSRSLLKAVLTRTVKNKYTVTYGGQFKIHIYVCLKPGGSVN